MNERIKRIVAGAGIVFILFILSYFLFRGAILDFYIRKACSKFRERYPAELLIRKANFKGLTGIELSGIFIIPENKDTFLAIDSMYIQLRLRSLLRGSPRIKTMNTKDGSIHFILRDSTHNNYSFLFHPSVKKAKPNAKVNFSDLLTPFLDNILEKIPGEFVLNKFRVKYSSSSVKIQALIPSLDYREGKIKSSVQINENDTVSRWFMNGNIRPREKTADFKIYKSKQDSLSRLPFLKPFANLFASADTLFCKLLSFHKEKEYSAIRTSIGACNFRAKHWRISNEDVEIKNVGLELDLRFGSDHIQADSTSAIRVNEIILHPFLKYTQAQEKTITFNINMPIIPASVFFSSLPEGLFPNTRGIEAKGELAYRMDFYLDSKQVDSLKFSSLLSGKNIKIKKYGRTDLGKINGDFNYMAYEKGKIAATLHLSPGSPDFTPLSEINSYLQASVMTSEDGNFYFHKGFNPEMFRRAIAINLNEKRFVRGGSTISMQLVKNVFLNRNKTISRKLEEALIVWLIEQNRLVSKTRMYEVYLNIIEWGPGVYGITQASEFYFKKKPKDLNLEESIFLAMIVPFPKWFRYQFDENGKLKESSNGYYQLLAGHLVKKGIITEEQKQNLKADVKIAGRAKDLIKVKDGQIAPEVIMLDEE